MIRKIPLKLWAAAWFIVVSAFGAFSMPSVRPYLPFGKVLVTQLETVHIPKYVYGVIARSSETIDVPQYTYRATAPIALGEIANPGNAYIHLTAQFRADSAEGYPNVFQTAPVNRGMRMEIAGSTATILIPDPSVPGGLKGLVLTANLEVARWYTLDVEALNGAYVRASLDGRNVADYMSAALHMETSQLLVGGGFDSSRAFRGTIRNISLTKGNFYTPIPLGDIKDPQDAYVDLKLRFRADDTHGYPNMFQTAPVNSGMRLEISGSTATILIPDSSVAGGLKDLPITSALDTGRWYALEVEARNGEFVRARLDGHPVVDYTSGGLSMKTSQLLVGGGFDSSRPFRGEMEDISVVMGNRRSPAGEGRGARYAFYLTLALGPLVFFSSFLWRRRASIMGTATNASALTLSTTIALLVGAGFLYYAYFLLVNGYLPSPFVWAKSETFMDLFHTLQWAYDDARYTEWKSVYPPLNFDIVRLLNFVLGGSAVGPAPLMRANSPYVIAGFCLLYLTVPALLLRTEYWKAQGLGQKAGVYIAILLSAPMLFALERGNLILLCPILLAVSVSRGGVARALCISLLVNLKPYFALLCILYVARKDWKGLVLSGSLSGGIFLLSGLFLDPNFLLFFRNLFGFAQSGNLFSLMEVLALPSSISAFSYALQLPHAHDIGAPLVTFSVFVIEAVKWLAIAICLLALLMKRQVMRDCEILALLVAVITNAGVFAGGYSFIYYAALIPVFLTMRDRRMYIGLLVAIAMPLDIIPLLSRFAGEQHSFLSDSNVSVRWTLGLGSVARPIANLVLLLLLSREILARECEESALLAGARRVVAWTRRTYPRVFAEFNVFVGLGGTLLAVLLYNSLYFNRYFPITEGWFSAYGHLIDQGSIPYRDFYLFLTPLYALLIAAIQAVFGEGFIVLRIFGIVVILLLSLLLYLILVRRISPFASFVSTVTAVVYYQSGVAHIAYDFIQLFTVFVLAATYLMLRYADRRARRDRFQHRVVALPLFFAGVLVALAFLTKQSNGTLVVLFSIPAAMVACSGQASRGHAARDVALYMLGMALPVLGCGIWLLFVDALVPFSDQVVFGAIRSKGSLGSIFLSWTDWFLTREYLIALRNVVLLVSLIIAASLLARVVANRWSKRSQFRMGDIQQILLFLLFFTVVLALSYTGWVNFKPGLMAPGRWFYSVAMVASTLVVFVLAVALPSVSLGVKSLRNFGVRHIDLTVIAIMALGLVSGNGTSAGISEISVFLGFALGLGLLLSLPDSYGASRVLVSALSLSFILFLTNSKFRQPYAWWYVSEPDVQLSTTKSSVPLLAGFQLSPSAAKAFDDATEAIQSHSKPGDDVFVFPHVPGLYLLSERWPRSKVVVSWFDFLPDPLARAEADRLLATPPTVIVNLKIPDAAWEAHERLFREGRPLGQRAIRAAIEGLTKEGSFQLDLSREVSPGCTLEVWHRATPQVRSDKIDADNINNQHMARR